MIIESVSIETFYMLKLSLDVEIEPGCGNWAWMWKLSLDAEIEPAVKIESGCGK